ncbi:MAG: hypothetical protein CMH54_08570 [Myxococcales bacterium]|nr:hypothetical protein [Myxococcales bacterium]|tara:strand:+ start:565 stop:924 length:360 start_codon:yes stop_codon:yes gene_type:complete
MDSEKRRDEKRIECDALVDYGFKGEVGLDHRLENISLGGACIRAAKVHPLGSGVVLMVHFRDSSRRSVEIRGEVVWSNADPPSDMGIRFTDMSPEAKAVLRRYVEERAASEKQTASSTT